MCAHLSPFSGSKRLSRRKRDSLTLVNGDASQLAKLPAVDSDEEDELVQLTSNKQANELGAMDHLGREHPFSPMVNREMLGNLVRRAFHQTEEQQTNFEQMLKHEYGRRSKGEVCSSYLLLRIDIFLMEMGEREKKRERGRGERRERAGRRREGEREGREREERGGGRRGNYLDTYGTYRFWPRS